MARDTVLSLNVLSMEWQNDFIPNMNTARGWLSCVYVPYSDEIFAIAGWNPTGSVFVQSIEHITVGSSNWTTLSTSLSTTTGGYGTRSVLANHIIWVIGGYQNYPGPLDHSDLVHTIDL